FSSGEDGCLARASVSPKADAVSFGSNCTLRTAPCSTFKITLAELGFKNKKLNPKGERFRWDGIKRDRDALNRDQDLLSWMKDSVVWVSSVVVGRIGQEAVHSELENMAYGNAAVGPEEFWINGPLSISAEELAKNLSRSNAPNLRQAIALLPVENIGPF